MELIPLKPFTEQLIALCRTQVADAIKHLNAYGYIECDRGLFGYEKAAKNSFKKQLELNENLLLSIDPEYIKIQ